MSGFVVSRRTFLKAGLTGVAACTLGGIVLLRPVRGSAGEAGEYVSLTTGRLFQGTPTTCGMCPAGCGLLAFSDAGELIGLAGNPVHPYNRGAICALGSASMNLVGSPRRVRVPWRRKGNRGEGQWEEISWEQAIEALSDAIGKGLDSRAHGPLAVCVPQRNMSPFLDRFVSFFPQGCLDLADGYELGVQKAVVQDLAGWACKGVADFENARVVLNFGANPLGSVRQVVGAARAWAEAIGRGARWITIDPRLSETANASAEWVPIRPGTDGPLAWALAHEIMKNAWEDRGVGPVDRTRLWASVGEWPPERAALVCGASAQRIRLMAREFALAERAVAVFGSGVTARGYGERDARSILLLNRLTGNIDRRGGYRLVGPPRWKQPAPRIAGPSAAVSDGSLFWALRQGLQRVGTLVTLDADPAVSDPECRATIAVLRDPARVPFHVALTTVWNETARQADLVLPASTWLGRWGLHQGTFASDGSVWVGLRRPVLPGQGAERAPEEMLLGAVKRLGQGAQRAFPFEKMESYYRDMLDASLARGSAKKPFDVLVKQGFISAPGRAGARGFAPRWEPGVLRWAGSTDAPAASEPGSLGEEKRAGCVRTLLLFGSPMREVDTPRCAWVDEIDHSRPLWVHPSTAAELGCGDGDWVIVRGPAGEIRTRLRLIQGLRPEAVAMQGTALGEAGADKPQWWSGQAYGANARELIPWPPDPLREAPGWVGTRVVIEKATG